MDLSSLVPQVQLHAIETYPNECCGLAIVFKGKLKYIPCNNMLTGDAFCIPSQDYIKAEEMGEVVGVCHSHCDIPSKPSKADIVACEQSNLPWLIVSLPNTEDFTQINPTGYKIPLIGRPFYHGVLDCYSLIKDYYKEILNIDLPDRHRDDKWWELGQNLYEDYYQQDGWSRVNDLKLHDVILMQNGSNVINHAAIYIGDGLIMHHCSNRLSSKDVYSGYWRKNTRMIVRYKDMI